MNNVIPQEAFQLFPDYDFYHDYEGNNRTVDDVCDMGALQFQESDLPAVYFKLSNILDSLLGYELFRVSFDASISYVPEGHHIVSYSWIFVMVLQLLGLMLYIHSRLESIL